MCDVMFLDKTTARIKIRAVEYGGQRQDRTADTRIFSPLLYRLSYLALRKKEIKTQISLSSKFFAEIFW